MMYTQCYASDMQKVQSMIYSNLTAHVRNISVICLEVKKYISASPHHLW